MQEQVKDFSAGGGIQALSLHMKHRDSPFSHPILYGSILLFNVQSSLVFIGKWF
jgi:hypothetical protein